MRIARAAAGTALAWAALWAGVSPAARAEEPPAASSPEGLAWTTEKVVEYMVGYGLVVKRGSATADAEGRCRSGDVPGESVLGCTWAATAKDEPRVVALRSEWVETKTESSRETPTIDVRELLRANVGRSVVLGLVREGEAAVSGTIVELLERAEPAPPAPPPPPYVSDARLGAWAPPPPLPPAHGSHVLMDVGGSRLALPIADVRTVRGEGLVARTTRKDVRVEREKRWTFDFGREAAGKRVNVRLLYFTDGFRWIPTYRLSGALVEDGDLALQGEVLNDAEDVADAEWGLVVGVPNFRFKEHPSPLALEAVARRALERSQAGWNSQFAQNVVVNDRVRAGRSGAADEPTGFDLAPGLAATGEQDLFVYRIGRFSLGKGARAALPLWNARVRLRHVYTWDGTAGRGWKPEASDVPRTDPGAGSPTTLSRNRTWHQLELGNRGTVPWTTGPALLLRDDQPLGQDLLAYTPVGGSSLLPVTVAVDVRTSYREEESGRMPNALRWNGDSYAFLEKRGTVTVVNYRKEPAAVRLSLDVVGKATAPSDGGTVSTETRDDVNVRTSVRWEATLAPGETATRTVSISYYVR